MKLEDFIAVNTSDTYVGVYKDTELIDEFTNDKSKNALYKEAQVVDFHVHNENTIAVMVVVSAADENSKEYKGYSLRESGNVKYLFKTRPYDEAKYFSARSVDGYNWVITKDGRRMSDRMCDFHTIVDIVESLNSSIKPCICHN